MDTPKMAEFAHIGKSVVIKGELSGSEDLYVDGTVEGTIELQGNNLVIGPNGHVQADVNAKGVIVQGKLEGDIRATERTELRKTAVVVGDIFTQRIGVEEGAYFKGKIDIQKEAAKVSAQTSSIPEPASVKTGAGGTSAAASGAAASGSAGVANSVTNSPLTTSTPVTKQ